MRPIRDTSKGPQFMGIVGKMSSEADGYGSAGVIHLAIEECVMSFGEIIR